MSEDCELTYAFAGCKPNPLILPKIGDVIENNGTSYHVEDVKTHQNDKGKWPVDEWPKASITVRTGKTTWAEGES